MKFKESVYIYEREKNGVEKKGSERQRDIERKRVKRQK